MPRQLLVSTLFVCLFSLWTGNPPPLLRPGLIFLLKLHNQNIQRKYQLEAFCALFLKLCQNLAGNMPAVLWWLCDKHKSALMSIVIGYSSLSTILSNA